MNGVLHVTRHFGDESFQTNTCTGTNKHNVMFPYASGNTFVYSSYLAEWLNDKQQPMYETQLNAATSNFELQLTLTNNTQCLQP